MQDSTETNLINLRRTIYLTIMSGLTFEETGHKLMKIELAARAGVRGGLHDPGVLQPGEDLLKVTLQQSLNVISSRQPTPCQ